MFLPKLPSPIQAFHFPDFENKNQLQFFVKRDDLIDDLVSGNKWRKLKFNLKQFHASDKKSIVTFGGAFSNHLLATAAACNLENIDCYGIVRGEELNIKSNSTLSKCDELGMKLIFTTRTLYKEKNTKDILSKANLNFTDFFEIPEGGANRLGAKGCEEIITENENFEYDTVACACGTATTLAGIINAVKPSTKVLGIAVLKGENYHHNLLKTYQKDFNLDFEGKDYQIIDDYHFGAYAKTNNVLMDFKEKFELNNGFQLDNIYTAKLFYGIWDLARRGKFKSKSKILLIHTGGLRSF